jgi:hypothetical protein
MWGAAYGGLDDAAQALHGHEGPEVRVGDLNDAQRKLHPSGPAGVAAQTQNGAVGDDHVHLFLAHGQGLYDADEGEHVRQPHERWLPAEHRAHGPGQREQCARREEGCRPADEGPVPEWP